MRLIDDEQVPARLARLPARTELPARNAVLQIIKLAIEERIRPGLMRPDRRTPLFVKDAEEQIEASQHLHKPLMNEWLGHEDENAPRASGEVQAMQDQPRFDRFPESHFIGEQHPRHEAPGDFAGDGHLVRDQIHPPADKAARGRLPVPAPALQRLDPQIEDRELIHLPGEQPVLGLLKLDGIRKLRLGDFAPFGAIDEQALAILHRGHHEFDALVGFNPVPSPNRTRRSGADFSAYCGAPSPPGRKLPPD